MVAAEDEPVTGAAPDRFHAATIGLNACGLAIMEATAVHRTPEIGIEFEIRAAPLIPHSAKQLLKVLLNFRMRTVENQPRAVPPTAKCHAIRRKWVSACILDEPVGMLLENLGLAFGDERRYPDRRLETAFADGAQHVANIASERRAGLEPIPHGRLVAVIDLDVFQLGNGFRNHVEVVEHLLGGDPRPKAIPGAPSGRNWPHQALGVMGGNPLPDCRKRSAAIAISDHKFLKFPSLAGSQL